MPPPRMKQTRFMVRPGIFSSKKEFTHRVRGVLFGALAILMVAGLSGCKMPRVHKITVQQGNVITQEMVDQLKPGMTRSQVAYIMGEPIFRNTFIENRWDYIYTISVPGYFESDVRLSLFFEDDALSYFTGDLAPSGTQTGEENKTASAAK